MLYQFFSPFQSLTIAGLKNVKFSHGYFATEDSKVAEKLRGKRDVTELTGVVEKASADVTAEAAARKVGRPRGVQTVEGARQSQEKA